tara:strand:+ start:84 stop:704 length:621 start_codon:yes stop_codon:yes gene_type:complete
MNLPRKDKDGISRLSYSQISLFKRSKSEYYESYIEGKPFEGNEYTDFGSKVGEALEHNDFSSFKKDEQETLKKVKRLDEFEREVRLNYEGFYVLGFIDSNKSDFTEIIDYKTGGLKKEFQYSKPDYNQLCLYALSLRQETGITPLEASVEFIRRKGNAFRGQALTVGDEVISIPVDISLERLKSVYWDTLNVAKEIEQFYKENMLN